MVFPRPSVVVIEHSFILQSKVRQELTVKSSTWSRTGLYLNRRTTQAPQLPDFCLEIERGKSAEILKNSEITTT